MKKIILFFLLSLIYTNIHSDIFTTNLFKLAKSFDVKGDYNKAIEYYNKFILSETNKSLIEKVSLRIARITQVPEKAVVIYLNFLSVYPHSKYRFIARYELATIYKIINDNQNSEKQFNILVQEAKGSSYWQKALLEIIEIEYNNNHFEKALQNIYVLLDKIEDYEDVSRSYFLLGLIMLKQKQYDDAEEFFLICAGSFPQSTRAPSSLLSLVKMYIKQKEYANAISTGKLLSQLYNNSLDDRTSKLILKKIKNKHNKNEKLQEIKLINLNDNPDLKDHTLIKIKQDINQSSINTDTNNSSDNSDDKITINNAFYIQLGYYSSLESAKQFIEKCKTQKKITDIYYANTRSAKSDKIFYRIVIGPFSSRDEANEKLIELKEKNIEAIVLELTKDYE